MSVVTWSIPAEPHLVGVLRERVARCARDAGLPAPRIADVRLAVTEALANVVRHAYPDGAAGPVDIEVRTVRSELTVTVSDAGGGVRPRPDSPGLGLGLPLIATLAETLELGRDEKDRTEVRMTFRLEPAGEAA